jgi:hypothetical protein
VVVAEGVIVTSVFIRPIIEVSEIQTDALSRRSKWMADPYTTRALLMYIGRILLYR